MEIVNKPDLVAPEINSYFCAVDEKLVAQDF